MKTQEMKNLQPGSNHSEGHKFSKTLKFSLINLQENSKTLMKKLQNYLLMKVGKVSLDLVENRYAYMIQIWK